MRDIHLNREMLRAIARGEAEPRALVRMGLEHLRCLCPTCASEWDAWEAEKQAAAADRFHDRIPGLLANRLQLIESEEENAREELRGLLAIEPAKRITRIVRSRNRYRNAALVRLLLAEARRAAHSDPQQAYHFADLGFHVADRLTGSDMAQGLVPLALAEMANALRIKAESQGARELFARSRALTQLSRVSDPSIIARIDHLEAVFHLNLRRFPEAENLLERAKVLYGLVGASAAIARVEISLCLLFLDSDQPERALQTVRGVLKRPSVREDQKLFLGARINLARALYETGDLRAARKVLDQDEQRQALVGEPLANLRYGWIRGRIATAERDFAAAKEHFEKVRDEFISAGVGYDAALVSLDLALACLRLGKPEVVKQLTEEMLPIFASQDIHREALAALRLFQEAVQHEILTEALVRDLKAYLQGARYQPEVRFRPGAGAGN